MTDHETKVQVFMSFFIDIATESHPEDIDESTMRDIVVENAAVYLQQLDTLDVDKDVDSYEFYQIKMFNDGEEVK